MDNPRPEKVAVVEEVRARLSDAEGALLTEYRGLTVAELAELRTALAKVGGEYKVYKNTLVKLAIAGGPQETMAELLTGPTAIAFVDGDVSAVAKALRDFSRTNAHLVIKGGVVGEGAVSAAEITALADLPSRDVLLAQLAGALAAPLRQLAGLFEALPRNLAYGLAALVDERRAGGEAPIEADAASETEAEAAPQASDTAEADAVSETEAEAAPQASDTAEADAASETDAETDAD